MSPLLLYRPENWPQRNDLPMLTASGRTGTQDRARTGNVRFPRSVILASQRGQLPLLYHDSREHSLMEQPGFDFKLPLMGSN